MDENSKKALNTSLPKLLQQITVNVTFKAAVLASGLWEEEFLDQVFDSASGKDLLFKLVLSLKKSPQTDAFTQFLSLLEGRGEDAAVEVLQAELSRHKSCSIDGGHAVDNEVATATSLMEKKSTVHHSLSDTQSFPIPSEQKGTHERNQNKHPTATSLLTGNLQEKSVEPQSPQKQLSVGECLALREEIKQVLPPQGVRNVGDIVVTKECYKNVYVYARCKTPSATPPGSLQVFDLSRKSYVNEFCFLPPACCLKLARSYGGRPQLYYHEIKGHPVLRAMDQTVQYCTAAVVLEPGNILKSFCWLSANYPLRETLADFTTWTDFRAKFCDRDEEVDLSATPTTWHPRSASTAIRIFSVYHRQGNLSIADKQAALARDVSSLNDEDEDSYVAVTKSYKREVVQFASFSTAKEPGPLKIPQLELKAINASNVSFLPPEACATLIELYGGEAPLRKTSHRGPDVLTDQDANKQYYSCAICPASHSRTEANPVGVFFLHAKATLHEAIAAAIGWYPSRGTGSRGLVELDFRMTVDDWFNSSRSNKIVVYE